MNLFANQAMASSGAAAQQGGVISFLPLIVIFFIFYFLLIRPQQNRVKLQKEMWEALKIGNKIITSSGVFGKITNINRKENKAEIEISENTIITITLDSVASKVEDKTKSGKKQIKKSSAIAKK